MLRKYLWKAGLQVKREESCQDLLPGLFIYSTNKENGEKQAEKLRGVCMALEADS